MSVKNRFNVFYTLLYSEANSKNKIIQYMELIIVVQTVVILFLSYKLYWYWKFYKSQMNLNNLKDKEKRITELEVKHNKT